VERERDGTERAGGVELANAECSAPRAPRAGDSAGVRVRVRVGAAPVTDVRIARHAPVTAGLVRLVAAPIIQRFEVDRSEVGDANATPG
jgi:hypothetical protein